MDFGDYCLIEQKRYGCENEMYLHKVVGALRSNVWVPVPVQSPATEGFGGGMTDVIRCICGGVCETEVLKYRIQDVQPAQTRQGDPRLHPKYGDPRYRPIPAPERQERPTGRIYNCPRCGDPFPSEDEKHDHYMHCTFVATAEQKPGIPIECLQGMHIYAGADLDRCPHCGTDLTSAADAGQATK